MSCCSTATRPMPRSPIAAPGFAGSISPPTTGCRKATTSSATTPTSTAAIPPTSIASRGGATCSAYEGAYERTLVRGPARAELRQHDIARALQVAREVDLDPRQARYVLDAERAPRRVQNDVPERLLVGQLKAP